MLNTKLIIASAFAASLALAGAATAADYSDNYTYDQPVSSNTDWSGNYVGAQLGATSSRVPLPFSSRTGVLMGAVAGTAAQSGNIVYGGEVELNFGEAEYRMGDGGKLQQSWAAAAKAKLGYAMDETMVYGTIGYGTAKFKKKGNTNKAPGWEGGLLMGVGVEQKVSGPVSVKAEYDYQRFYNVKSEVNGARRSDDLNNHSLKFGVNYRF